MRPSCSSYEYDYIVHCLWIDLTMIKLSFVGVFWAPFFGDGMVVSLGNRIR